jgi:hypothetical protein
MENSPIDGEWRGVDLLGNDLALRPCSQESRGLVRRQLVGSVAVAIAIAAYAAVVVLAPQAAAPSLPAAPIASSATALNANASHFPAGQSLSTRSNAWEKPVKE